MIFDKFFGTFLFYVSIQGLSAVKINVHGSVSMGKEILSFLEHYAIKSQFMNSRRSGSGSGPPLKAVTHESDKKDLLTIFVRSQSFCQNLEHCDEKMEKLLSSYIVVLVKSLENILEKLFQLAPKLELKSSSEEMLEKFHEGLKIYFTKVEDLIRRGNAAINHSKENSAHTWVGIMKKMNALFQKLTEDFLRTQLYQNRMEIKEVKKLLTQKIIIASAAVEEKYLATLCQQHKICEKTFYVSETIYKIIKTLSAVTEDKIADFMKDFAAALRETHFYNKMTDPIFFTFQEVIDNISNPNDVKTRDILSVILNTIELRVQHMYQDLSKTKTQDIYLFHSVLSDMDHIYDKMAKFPFDNFQEDFVTFVKYDGHITPKLVNLFKEIEEQFALEPEELMYKLKNEAKTFFQITLEIDN